MQNSRMSEATRSRLHLSTGSTWGSRRTRRAPVEAGQAHGGDCYLHAGHFLAAAEISFL